MASGFVDISGVEQGEATCDLVVVVRGLGPTQGWDFMLEMFQLARRGDGGDRVDDEILPAPTSDQTITLDARAEEIDVEGSDFGEGDCTDDTFAVDLRLTLTTLRD